MMSTKDDDPNEGQYSEENWIKIVLTINSEVRGFKDHLTGVLQLNTRSTYFDEWNEFYAAVCDEHLANPDVTYEWTTKYLFGEISTLEDYVHEALKLYHQSVW
jgi:hypothetical protein